MLSLAELMTRKEAGSALVMGNHALARAMAEAGRAVITSYPGSPTPEIAEALPAPAEKDSPGHEYGQPTPDSRPLELFRNGINELY
jgi:indolepyruvate ferredoxin oxidoreductase alpha subunit